MDQNRQADAGPPIPVLVMVATVGPGGTEKQAVELARHLDRARFIPHFACFDASGFRARELRDNGIPILELSLRSLLSRSYIVSAFQLRRYLDAYAIRLVHSFDFPTALFAIPLCHLWGGRVVLASQRGHRDTFPPKYRKLLKLSDLAADGFIVNCAAMRKHLIDDCGIPERRVRLCYNGIDLRGFPPRSFEPASGPAGAVVGAVSVLRPEKGIETLLDAFAAVRRSHPEARLRIIGDGPLRESLLQRSLGLFGDAGVGFFELSTNQVAERLHEIDIFVLPSLSEALSNSLMEALASGCAVVASRTGGNPELVQDGENGLLFTPGDAADLAAKLNLLLEDSVVRRRLAEAGQTAVRGRFSMEASARCVERIYDEFLRSAHDRF